MYGEKKHGLKRKNCWLYQHFFLFKMLLPQVRENLGLFGKDFECHVGLHVDYDIISLKMID